MNLRIENIYRNTTANMLEVLLQKQKQSNTKIKMKQKILNLIKFPLEKTQNREEHIKLFCEDAVRKIQIVGNNRINASALSEYMGGIKD